MKRFFTFLLTLSTLIFLSCKKDEPTPEGGEAGHSHGEGGHSHGEGSDH